ncbi:hypothetical protein [Frankia sp. EAN1pec]|uniref:hypothetical protein n=1 Tax=Parafrankia sp. (strain EAN1pec) TaxID=298653 RepID=UPI0003028283
MTAEPYASARRVFWIVDNGSVPQRPDLDPPDERGLPDRDAHLPPGPRLLAEPGGDLFSILQRKAIERGDFTDLDALGDRVMGFQDLYNQTADPFGWKYTRADPLKTANRLALAA